MAELRFSEYRYDCPECWDTGMVKIWHPQTIAKAIKQPDEAFAWKTCVVRCTCAAADRVATSFRAERNPTRKDRGQLLPTFGDRPWHINANHPDAKAKAATFDSLKSSPAYYQEFEQYEGTDNA